MQTMNIIGCGKLGQTLGWLFYQQKLGKILSIYNTRLANSMAAIKFMGTGIACQGFSALLPADFYFITTPDDVIRSVCDLICKLHQPKSGSIFVHCSGLLKSDVLASAKALGCYTASLHPLQTYARAYADPLRLQGAFCSVEGDEIACDRLKQLFEALFAYVIEFNKDHKTNYHAASVMASNYIVSMFHHAMQLYMKAGIAQETAKAITQHMIERTLDNIAATHNIADALTGPISRGDLNTVATHIADMDNEMTALYQTLGRYTLPLTQHNETLKTKLAAMLQQ